MQRELSSEIKNIRAWAKKNKVVDVVLFGSHAREKSRPNDIDICIIINDCDEKNSIDLVDSLGKVTDKSSFKFQINILASSAVASGASLTKSLLTEGISLMHNQSFSSVFGFRNRSIFTYSLRRFGSSKKVRFHYLLRGRYGSAGILKEVEGTLLGNGIIEVPTAKEDALKEVRELWKVDYKIQRALFS